jgi:EpsD family peptidyl-prolyl cis-trans isomerase
MLAFAARPAALVLLLGLAACAPQDPGQRAVVKVNRESITLRQLQEAVDRQPGLSAEQRAAAASQVLERLIDQELALQQAEALKLDRDPRVAAQLEAARRELLARAYAQTLVAEVPPLAAADLQQQYEAAPALYAQRQVFMAQELSIEGSSTQVGTLQAQVPAGSGLDVWAKQAQTLGLRAQLVSAVRPTEQWPAALQATLVSMADGQVSTLVRPGGLLVLQRMGAQPAPLSLDQARPLIEQQLQTERRQAALQDGLRRLREQAQLTYLGSIGPASAPAGPSPTP